MPLDYSGLRSLYLCGSHDAGLEQPIANWAKRVKGHSVVVENGIASRVLTRRP